MRWGPRATGCELVNITKWNIWHCYSSSVVGPRPNIDAWARAAVEMDAASVAVGQDGECWYKADGETRVASCALGFVPNRAEALFQIPSGMPPYAQECLGQAMAMRTHEQHVLADPLSRVPSYVRLYFEECELEFGSFSVSLYPQAKLYEDGILLVELRVLGGEPYTLDEFVDEQVNLYARLATGGEIPLPVLLGAASHGFSYGRRRLRMTMSRFRQAMHAQLGKLEDDRDGGDFILRRARLNEVWATLVALDLAPYNLRALANLHVWCLLDVASEIDRPHRARRRLGDYWGGRPSVYIAGTDPPVREAEKLLRDHRAPLLKILARSSTPLAADTSGEAMGPNLRPFGDYALFVNRGVTLWFGLDDTLFEPPQAVGTVIIDQEANLGGFVSTKQVQVEFLEYWYMAHKALEEKSLEPSRSLASLARMERQLAALDRQVEEVPPSGEVADVLRHAGECLNVSGIRKLVRANLRFKEVALQEQRDRRNNVFGAVLAVLLALTGVPAVGESLVTPAWNLAGLPRPDEDAAWKLLSGGIALGGLGTLALLAALVIHGVRRRV